MTPRDLRAALAALDEIRHERAGVANRMASLEHEIVVAEENGRRAREEHLEAAGLRTLGEIPADAVERLRLASAAATDHVHALSSALRVLRDRLTAIEDRERAAESHRNAIAATLAEPLLAKHRARIEQLSEDLAREMTTLARLSAAGTGAMATGARFSMMCGEPASILRRHRIRLHELEFNHELDDRRDAMDAESLLALLPADLQAAAE